MYMVCHKTEESMFISRFQVVKKSSCVGLVPLLLHL